MRQESASVSVHAFAACVMSIFLYIAPEAAGAAAAARTPELLRRGQRVVAVHPSPYRCTSIKGEPKGPTVGRSGAHADTAGEASSSLMLLCLARRISLSDNH